MNLICKSIKITRKELDAINANTVGEQYTPFLQLLKKQVEGRTDEDSIIWYLYDRFPNGWEGDVILILKNQPLSESTTSVLNTHLVAKFNSNWELVKPIRRLI